MKFFSKIKNKFKNNSKDEAELLAKLGGYSTKTSTRFDVAAIPQNEDFGMVGFKAKSNTNLGYIRKLNCRQKTGYTGCDSLFFINNRLNESIDAFSFHSNVGLKITVPIMSGCDEDYKSLTDISNGVITQLLINEYDQVVVRYFDGVSYLKEAFDHDIDNITLRNSYILTCGNPTPFVTLSDAQFIEKFDKLIKKIGPGEYVGRLQKEDI